MLRRVLDDAQEELLAEERRLLAALDEALARFEEAADDRKILRRAALQLDELFLLVVAGEFNSGKSAFINALVGSPLLAEGVTPTTIRIQLLRYGPAPAAPPVSPPAPASPPAPPPAPTAPSSAAPPPAATSTLPGDPAALDVVTAPLELLREIHIVDTPGTNAIHREHEAITRDFVPRSDLVLFVTSADRPFTESERAFLQGIREWGKKVVLAINKIDILDSPAAVDEVRAFVAEHAAALLGAAPDVFPVSARLAQRAKAAGDAALAAASRFAALEDYIVETLDERQRLRLKLLNPIGIAGRLAARYREMAATRLALLAGDVAAIDDVERQLALYREDMAREFRFRLADVGGVLQEFEARGMQFFDDTLRLGRVFDLLNKARVKAEFGKQVVGDAPRVIDRRVHEVIDWMIAADLRQWQAVMEHVGRRRREHDERIVGQVGGAFELDRERLLASVGRAAQDAVERYDQEGESTRLAEAVQGAIASTALVEVGAIGLGVLVAHVLAGAAADATGVLAASVVAVLGLFIIPSRRQAAKRELRAKIAALREQLMAALTGQFDRELERGLRRIDEAIAPYTRFVRAEGRRLGDTAEELDLLAARLDALARRVESLTGNTR
ncbi:MAG TPA: dynamin family protein [Thermoanaerobaculia bacterium]|jgi:signal recognition particle receptor subunit beta|nr:dynamin family protein [Thermoanaerobaculia bacterium]